MLAVVALLGLSLTACDNDDLNTDQYGSDVRVQAFGPCPVLRGGTLFFYGSNLDQIKEIDLPGADAITSIEVTALRAMRLPRLFAYCFTSSALAFGSSAAAEVPNKASLGTHSVLFSRLSIGPP